MEENCRVSKVKLYVKTHVLLYNISKKRAKVDPEDIVTFQFSEVRIESEHYETFTN